jgi:hypothetical protein
MINDASRNKEDNAEFFITWNTKAKGEKPTLDKKYQGEKGRAAFLKHMTTTNFWRIDGDEKILGEFYDLATTCVTGYMKPIILSYLHFLLDGENPVAKSHYNRDRMLTTMHDLIQQCCIKDSNGNSCITDGKRAASFQLDLTAQRGKVRGDLALFRILYNPRKETKYISHSEKMFVERAQKNGWPKADSSVLENIASIVYEDYDLLTELDPESDKEQYDSYLNDINALELVIKDIEENELTSSQQRRDFFDRIIKIYGDRERIGFNYYPKKRFEDARERLLTEEEVKNLKSAEKDN